MRGIAHIFAPGIVLNPDLIAIWGRSHGKFLRPLILLGFPARLAREVLSCTGKPPLPAAPSVMTYLNGTTRLALAIFSIPIISACSGGVKGDRNNRGNFEVLEVSTGSTPVYPYRVRRVDSFGQPTNDIVEINNTQDLKDNASGNNLVLPVGIFATGAPTLPNGGAGQPVRQDPDEPRPEAEFDPEHGAGFGDELPPDDLDLAVGVQLEYRGDDDRARPWLRRRPECHQRRLR